MQRNILLNPGPATISMRVKKAQIVSDICPREREFGDLMHKISLGLLDCVEEREEASCVLFGGSGTLAVESVLSCVVGHSDKIVIIVNGAYGARMYEIAQYHKLRVLKFESDFLAPIEFLSLQKFLEKERPKFLGVVHSETTSGLLNNLEQISNIAKPLGIKIIADCMSSFACYQLSLKDVDFIIASSNKNLQSVAGISFVIAKQEEIQKAIYARSLYLDLKAQNTYFLENHQMRFTPPVQVAYALYEAILELKEEGMENRFLRYKKSNFILRNGLEELGFEIYPKVSYSVIITSIDLPKTIIFEELHQFCKKHGFTIYPGKIAGREMFRIANIGDIDAWDIKLFLQILKDFINKTKICF